MGSYAGVCHGIPDHDFELDRDAGLNGFIGEFFILQGTFAAPGLWPYAALAVIGIVLGAAYMLWLYQRVMFGKLENPLNKALPDLNMRELATFAPSSWRSGSASIRLISRNIWMSRSMRL